MKSQTQTIKAKIIFDPINRTRKHDDQSTWKSVVICSIGGDIDLYYSWFLKNRFNLILNRALRCAHITLVNDRTSDISNYDEVYKKYNGKEITFTYNPEEIRSNGKHWWLKVYSEEAKEIRKSLGLSEIPYMPFHLTIGYSNEKTEYHSKYILRQILNFDL